MEEDIKILESHINQLKEYEDEQELVQAIENLIKGYRKLKLENQALENTQQNCPMMNTSGFQCEHKVEDITHIVNKTREDFVKQYIPKSKLKEKIEELKLPNIIVGGRRNYKVLEYGKKLGKLEILQELLEEEYGRKYKDIRRI